MDKIEHGISNRYGLRFIYVDTTETAKTLEGRHLCGPAAAMVLGEGLVAAALLSSKLKKSEEIISLQFKVDGPIKGVHVEASGGGELRGYTEIKLLDEFDDMPRINTGDILGSYGLLTIFQSNNRKILYSGQIELEAPDIRTATAKYFNQSEQVPTGVEFCSRLEDFHISTMKGLMVQKMPGADTGKFVEVLELLNDRKAAGKLERAGGILDFSGLLAVEDLVLLKEKPLKFYCGCSYEKSAAIMGTLSPYELQEIIRSKEPQKITCHFCGETYLIKTKDVSTALLNKADTKKPA